jgi:hypothetical protein
MMKLAYYFTRRQFGKVLMPLKVHSARLPPAFGMFYGKGPEHHHSAMEQRQGIRH